MFMQGTLIKLSGGTQAKRHEVGEERVGKKGFSRRGEEIKEGDGNWKRLKFIICMYKTAKK